jgi:CheY-like chemotaxis protein
MSAEAPPLAGSETILVVEDDPDVRLVTVSRLESLGYRVRTAGDGASALEAVKAFSDIRLALLDIVMPGGMDGHALADEIEKQAPGVKLILTSGYSARMAAADSRTGRPFLPKPATRLQMAHLIRSMLDQAR